MRDPLPNPVHTLFRKIGASSPGLWISRTFLHHLDPVIHRLSRGKTTLSQLIVGVPVAFVTMKGAKTGILRTIPLLSIPDGQTPGIYALVASNWGRSKNPAWFYNLKANPDVTCVIAGVENRYLAREVSGEVYARYWGYAVKYYPGYEIYKKRTGNRHIPIMILKRVVDFADSC